MQESGAEHVAHDVGVRVLPREVAAYDKRENLQAHRSPGPAPSSWLTFNTERADMVKVVAVQVCIHPEQPPKYSADRVPEVLGEGHA